MSTPPPSTPPEYESDENQRQFAEVVAYVLGEQDESGRAAFEQRLEAHAELADLVQFVLETIEYRRDERELGVSAAAIAHAKRAFSTHRPGLLKRLRDGGARVIASLDFDTRLAPGALGVRGGSGAQLAFSAAQAEVDFELIESADSEQWLLRGQVDSDAETAWTVEVVSNREDAETRTLQTTPSGGFTLDLPEGEYTIFASHDHVDGGVIIEIGPIHVP